MKDSFELVVGIEVHVVLNSKTKMFSSSKSSHNDEANTNINPIDLGLPGTMPSPNETCIRKAIILAKALNMEIEKRVCFDRKNYFYQDLPKGFQITQQFYPIGKNGWIELENGNKISISRIHLEEDTAKQTVENDEILLDYNRSGMPLIEIVTDACIHNPTDAMLFLKQLKRILVFNDISDAKMEEGSMRADVNISIRPIGSSKFGTRVEIKNINSISNVDKAIEYEFNKQIEDTLLNNEILMSTKKYDDKTQKTEFTRLKTSNVDYHYMLEPNIYFRNLSQDFVDETITKFVDISSIKNELLENKVSNEYVNLLLDNYILYKYFYMINLDIKNPNEVIRWLCIEFVGALTKNNKTIYDVSLDKFEKIKEILILLNHNEINGKQAKEIIKIMIETDKTIREIIDENNFKQITDKNILKPILEKYMNQNINMLYQYDSRPERVEKFFIGMIMKETNGQANPDVINEIFKELIINYKK